MIEEGESKARLAGNPHGYTSEGTNNGQRPGIITAGVDGGSYSAGGRLVIRSVLDTQLPTAGNSSEYEDRYSFRMLESGVSPTSANSCLARERSKYNFGKDLTLGDGCMWSTYNRIDDLLIQGKTTNEKHSQNYQWNGTLVEGTRTSDWNVSGSSDGNTISNRAIGQTSETTEVTTVKNQSSNSSNSTELNKGASLLGLQSLTPRYNKLDTNSNRPQLQTLYRRVDDAFESRITDNNSIGGVRSRTGLQFMIVSLIIPHSWIHISKNVIILATFATKKQ
jgi:hypothetical protein